METEALNIPAVALGAVVAFLFGWVLYHPRVLGRIWADGSGVELGGNPPAAAFVFQVVALICLAIVIGMTATVNFLLTFSVSFVHSERCRLVHRDPSQVTNSAIVSSRRVYPGFARFSQHLLLVRFIEETDLGG